MLRMRKGPNLASERDPTGYRVAGLGGKAKWGMG